MKYSATRMLEIAKISTKIAEAGDLRIYRIISGKFKLRNDGELDMRFKENHDKTNGQERKKEEKPKTNKGK